MFTFVSKTGGEIWAQWEEGKDSEGGEAVPMRATVVSMNAARRRGPRMPRVIEANRRLRPKGRAWVNGREVGGADPRYAHLSSTHD
jgi:hypothetical protein